MCVVDYRVISQVFDFMLLLCLLFNYYIYGTVNTC